MLRIRIHTNGWSPDSTNLPGYGSSSSDGSNYWIINWHKVYFLIYCSVYNKYIVDLNSRKIEQNTRKKEQTSKIIEQNSRKIEQNSRKIEQNSWKIERKQSRKIAQNLRKIEQNSRNNGTKITKLQALGGGAVALVAAPEYHNH